MPLACVLISDITGSTQIYEREDNETALGYMLPILDRMRELISENDGICVKSKGDDTISFFPTSENAFNAAWAMVNEPWHLGMSVHAGIYFGEVLRQDAGLYGSAVNTAARLASLAKPREVLLGANCIDGLGDDNRARVLPIGDLHLKGKDEPTQVFAASVSSMAATTMVFAKRRMERPSRTEMVDLTYGNRTWHIGEGEKLSVGRSSECDIVVDCAWVSRRHGEFSIRQWQLEYADHSSAGSIVKVADGDISLHRRATMLNGSGTIVLGSHATGDENCTIGFVAQDISILATES